MMLKNETVLLKDGCWELRSHHSRKYLLVSFIQHYCPVLQEKRYWYSIPLMDHKCSGCQEYVPEDMMGLWKLHNMDYIQSGKSH